MLLSLPLEWFCSLQCACVSLREYGVLRRVCRCVVLLFVWVWYFAGSRVVSFIVLGLLLVPAVMRYVGSQRACSPAEMPASGISGRRVSAASSGLSGGSVAGSSPAVFARLSRRSAAGAGRRGEV